MSCNQLTYFYHKQDADDLKDNGSCYLAWSGDGNKIKEILEKHDIKVDWDGTETKRIHIDIN